MGQRGGCAAGRKNERKEGAARRIYARWPPAHRLFEKSRPYTYVPLTLPVTPARPLSVL